MATKKSNNALPSITRGSSAASGAARIQQRRAAKLESLTSNPFKMPSDAEVFQLRDEERRRKKEDKEKMKNLKIWEKSTWSTRLVTNRTGEEGDIDGDGMGMTAGSEPAVAPRKGAVATASENKQHKAGKERRKEKENIRDFIAKKREMFLVQMSLDTKRSEIKKLEELAAQREQLLRKNEQMLEEDAMRFDAFLKENDMRAIDAMDRAEVETKAKQEKLQEIKKLNAQISVIKQEMSKAEDQLTNCRRYKKFLDSLTPPSFFEEEMAKKKARQAERRQKRREAKFAILKEQHNLAKQEAEQNHLQIKSMGRERSRKNMARQASVFQPEEPPPSPTMSDVSSDEEGYSSGEDLPMYFKDPQQLLDIFTALEEKNLFLIQNSQETEEALEELKQKYKETQERMDHEANNLKAQISGLQSSIGREETKASHMQNRARRMLGAEDKEALLKHLHSQITGVYLACGFDNESLGALEMLTNIEAKLESLLEVVSRMPPDYVETAEKAREKERRHRAREEKLERQRKDQEKRLQKSLARSKAPVIKKTGKPVMFRSMPKARKRKDKDEAKRKAAEEDDIREFFQ
eukprot:TRINITY_DN13085_c0_g2_i1.p1 TRINITY_DN13085_c0_g2~~TRINITY_DN13085_c0_g2_i1.p1  ORF type:complete len:578 (+),score=174.27 TRINITY_DN13085_c0_g2_i1:240-1973(+)